MSFRAQEANFQIRLLFDEEIGSVLRRRVPVIEESGAFSSGKYGRLQIYGPMRRAAGKRFPEGSAQSHPRSMDLFWRQ